MTRVALDRVDVRRARQVRKWRRHRVGSSDGLSWTRLDTGALFAGAPIVSGVVVGSRLELFASSAGGKLVAAISAP